MWATRLIEPGFIVFLVLATAKAGVEIYAARRAARRASGRSRSLSIAFIVLGSMMPLGIAAETLLLGHALPVAPELGFAVFYALALALRVASVRALGGFYSVDIILRDDHRLVRSGPYAFLRHPIYLVGIVEAFAYPLACGAWLTAIVETALCVPAVLFRRREEEKLLLARFGGEYEDYRRRTPF